MTKPWGDLDKAKVLVIGHDPKLQNSLTEADYTFFADYYFKPKPKDDNEKKKYELAESVFSYIHELTNGKYGDEEFYLSNLCNNILEKKADKKTVYIPKNEAKKGIQNIKKILSESNIEIIFAMSQQVNYWLQKLGFYEKNVSFLKHSKPKKSKSKLGIYEPKKEDGIKFNKICGKKYKSKLGTPLFPIYHIKFHTMILNEPPSYLEFFVPIYRSIIQDCKSTISKL